MLTIILLGCGATAILDAWLLLLKWQGVPTMNMAFLGRWAAHLLRGQFAHEAIACTAPVAGERALGWLVHYLIGVAFAALLVGFAGVGWLAQPTLPPALVVGVATVAAPLTVMQPAMGMGFAASRTPTPWRNRLRSLANHTVFGFGLYLTALLIKGIAP